ncbi:MAG: 23S rRNA (guanosine(2251)-2'-O)-methyltransferase RlmB [Bacillota bacterium]|jgi:23S rRNA (guanosine2251-2'-O)-methyltransferase
MKDLIPGRNGVAEALRSGREIVKIYVAEGRVEGSLKGILARAKEQNVPVRRLKRSALDDLYPGNHQGVLAEIAAYEYADIDDMLAAAAERGEPPFLLMLSEIESPHNLGAIMRTAETAGVHGVIIPKDNSVGLNATVAKIACGAAEYLPVARVTNLVRAAKELQEKGLWVYGADMDGTPLWEQDMTGPVLLIVGGEDRGIPRLLKEQCDFTVTIPMRGHISSLNASVAAGIMMYEIVHQKGRK